MHKLFFGFRTQGVPSIVLFVTALLEVSLATGCGKGNDNVIVATPLATAATPVPSSAPVAAAETIQDENPLDALREVAGFYYESRPNYGAITYEFGIGFVPEVDGNLHALVLRSPVVDYDKRIAIWERATGRLMRSHLIAVTESNRSLIAPIYPLPVKKGVEYIVSYNANDHYTGSNAGDRSPFPFQIGNLRMTGFYYSVGAGNTVPLTQTYSTFFGGVSFVFRKNP